MSITPLTPRSRGARLGASFAMFRNAKSLTGLSILAVFVVVAVFADQLAPFSPTQIDATARLQPPSGTHWFGTTHLGEDVLSQVIYGTRGVVVVGALTSLISMAIALVIGVLAGYLPGWRSEALSALANVFLVIPGIPILIIVASRFTNPPLWVVAAILGILGWGWGARVLRAQTMSLRNRDFVQAAKLNGEPLRRIIGVEMLPNLTALIASSFVGSVTAAILGLTTLSYIGVIPVNAYNWGTILNWASAQGAFTQNQWWWFLPPGLCIAAIGVALALLNFGIDEYINPRLRSAGELARAMRRKGLDTTDGVTAVTTTTTQGSTTR